MMKEVRVGVIWGGHSDWKGAQQKFLDAGGILFLDLDAGYIDVFQFVKTNCGYIFWGICILLCMYGTTAN